MSVTHISTSDEAYHLSGEMLSTDMDAIQAVIEAMFAKQYVRVKSRKDLYVEVPDISLNIYFQAQSKHAGAHYLLGGNLLMTLSRADEVTRQLASLLDAAGIVYALEVDRSGAGEGGPELRVSHRDFDSLVRE